MMTIKLNRGFTLVEMAVVLVIIGLLIGGLLIPLSAQLDQRNYSDTRRSMDEAREALIAYGMSHGYLPCPANSDQNGAEDRDATGYCTGNKRVGYLPWAELGLPKLDSWGHLYRYSVALTYANKNLKISVIPVATQDITITTRNAAGTMINLSNDNAVPAVIMSFGKIAGGATNNDGTTVADVSVTNVDEDSNKLTIGKTYISRDISENSGVSGGEFDDIVIWLSPNVYLNRMVSVGQLP